jgi:hypothetical protein
LTAFERGKKDEADKNKKPAPPTPTDLKAELFKKAIQLKDDPYILEKFEAMGRSFTNKS